MVASAPTDALVESEAQIASLAAAIADLEPRRQRTLDLYERGRISSQELDERLDQITSEQKVLDSRRSLLHIPEREEEPIEVDLLEMLRERLDAGLSDEDRSEIVRLLVKQITVNTKLNHQGGKDLSFVIEYRFSPDWCSQNCNGRDSSRRPA